MLSSTSIKFPHQKIANGTVKLDEKTGLPEDYHSFFAAYRPLVMATAERLNIPQQDREDAAQEVQIKFWLKNGLDMYDPSRNTKFATLLRNWAGMFMLQERDKVKKQTRNLYKDPLDWALEVEASANDDTAEEFVPTITSNEFIQQWLDEAQKALEASDKRYLVPVLKLCVRAAEDGKAPTRAQIASTANVAISRATPLVKELRALLTDVGLGIESLYDY